MGRNIKVKLGTKERSLLFAMKNTKGIEANLNVGVVSVGQKAWQRQLKQEEIAQVLSAALLGQNDFLEPDEVEKLMYETEGVTPIYYANIIVDYLDLLFEVPEEYKKKETEAKTQLSK